MINIPDINLKDERLIIIICVIFFIIYLCNHPAIDVIASLSVSLSRNCSTTGFIYLCHRS